MYVTKTYLAVVQGTLEKGRRGTVRASVKVEGAWRPAVTRFRVLATARGAALLALRPLTGRKHQLRIHCARYLGAPIVGDYRQGSWCTLQLKMHLVCCAYHSHLRYRQAGKPTKT